MAAAELRRHGRLADGMVIVASLRARLLGMRLLEVDADVTVSPTTPRLTLGRTRSGRDARETRKPAALAPSNGSIGGRLDIAARSLEASTAELEAARQRMP